MYNFLYKKQNAHMNNSTQPSDASLHHVHNKLHGCVTTFLQLQTSLLPPHHNTHMQSSWGPSTQAKVLVFCKEKGHIYCGFYVLLNHLICRKFGPLEKGMANHFSILALRTPWTVQFSSVAQLCQTRWNPMNHSTPGLPVHHQLLESTQTHIHWVGDAIQPSHPLSSPSPPALNFPSIRVFSKESALHIKWPKYWSFSINISPSNEHPGLISFRMDWVDLLAVQGTLKSLLQHHSSKASVFRHSAFFIVQLSHPYVTTGKTIALMRRTFVGKVMYLLFNMLSRLVITFLPRSKCFLISWLQSPSAVILEPRKIKWATVSTVSPSICHEVMGPDGMILVFWMLSFKPTFSFSFFHFHQEAL